MKFLDASLIALAALAFVGCSDERADSYGKSSHAITSGTPDDSDRATVWIVGEAKGQKGYCSGVVVAPRVVLTAAHCLRADADFKIFLGDDYGDADAKAKEENYVAVTEQHPHSKWDPNQNLNDIAVLVTETDLPGTPVPILEKKMTTKDVGATVRIAGFGQTSGADKTFGRRHSAETTIKALDDTGLAIDGTPNICFYDSGGPTFLTRDGKEYVVGIHSISEKASCDGQGVDTRADAYLAFVEEYIEATKPAVADPTTEDAGAPTSDGGTTPTSEAPASTSGCAVEGGRRSGPGRDGGPLAMAGLALLGLAVARRRRA